MEIRELRQDERDAAFFIGSQAFMHGSRDRVNFDRPEKLPRRTFGVWDEAGLQAMAGVIDYRVHLGATAAVGMGGVAAVACLPAARGKGYAGDCLRFALARMREDGQAVSVLHPFSFDFYDRFGWVWVGVSRTYEVKTRILKPATETERVRAAGEPDRAAIIATYTAHAGRYRGAVARSEIRWNQVLSNSEKEYRYIYVYEDCDRVEGYVTYIGGKRESTRLSEFVALTPGARRGLLGLLRRHEMQIEKFVWAAPCDDPLWHALMHWEVKTRLEPIAQARIVDLPEAIRAWRPDAGVSAGAVIEVGDNDAPWNAGRWRIEFSGGAAAAERTGAPAQMEITIRELAQAYFGTPSLSEIRAGGGLKVFDEAGYEALRAGLAGPPMWMNDDF